MNMNFAKFTAPVLGEDTQELYSKLYGDAGNKFVDVLSTSPDEIAVISKMIAFLNKQKEAK
ncbi:MAG: hypothetical protein IKK09_06180 [Clostridia bacterium]|nr:hypothetical protein [Clostridia bacterium]